MVFWVIIGCSVLYVECKFVWYETWFRFYCANSCMQEALHAKRTMLHGMICTFLVVTVQSAFESLHIPSRPAFTRPSHELHL